MLFNYLRDDAGAFIGTLAEYEDQKTIRQLEFANADLRATINGRDDRIKILEEQERKALQQRDDAMSSLRRVVPLKEEAESRIEILEADLLKRDERIEELKGEIDDGILLIQDRDAEIRDIKLDMRYRFERIEELESKLQRPSDGIRRH